MHNGHLQQRNGKTGVLTNETILWVLLLYLYFFICFNRCIVCAHEYIVYTLIFRARAQSIFTEEDLNEWDNEISDDDIPILRRR